MNCKKEKILTNSNELRQAIIEKQVHDELDKLFLLLNEQYPGDVGCFVIANVNVSDMFNNMFRDMVCCESNKLLNMFV